ncbi:MAG: hypothetical protein K8R60_09015 [Burkholderiales bacterium]|nr:hypothetical protein [Burkholderiales bacterium]
MSRHAFAAALLLLAAAGGASAQSAVYRCGNEYTRTPCNQGGTMVDTQNSARTAAQRAEAQRVAAAERKLAEDMERDRRRAEAANRPVPAVDLGPAKPASQAKNAASGKAKKKKNKKDAAQGDDFVAVVPKAKT